ncbi:uroporphyrinogen-III synthase [Frondihabitans sp. VKM Ac-2883]|uniref:uroporphyrinogen-III synthase n=1 Tax=Frondihabitans sp. VKM Ac-2883 TaxID=2783823 RepID=UPI00188D2AFA|nr:uroporphyrinogen-III synthase [Frondihabitans sp. VKM Ac-2883]MBF4577170.1 uroporphyrinogen-III synthase [Frondihabitans sp. VKM Ac-2883]
MNDVPSGGESASVGFRSDQLDGFRIGVTSDRRSADLIDALKRRGATVLHAPTLTMADKVDDDPILADTRAMIDTRPDVLLATTSYGIRRWFEVADAGGLGDELVEGLADTTILVRGPKARGGIRAAGLNDTGMSDQETTASLVTKTLADFPEPKTVAIQLHGYTDEHQLDRLRAAGHRVLTVAPYRWLSPDTSDARVERLIEAISGQQLDAVTFTSAPAVDALFSTAEALGRLSEVAEGFRSAVLAAAVGPVTASPLISLGIPVIQPDRFRLGALIKLVCDELEQQRVTRINTRHGPLELRGAVVRIDGKRAVLPPTALALLRTLVTAGGDVVSRAQLAASTPALLDDHALEVALSRLRQTVKVPGLVETVIKRGYRLAL